MANRAARSSSWSREAAAVAGNGGDSESGMEVPIVGSSSHEGTGAECDRNHVGEKVKSPTSRKSREKWGTQDSISSHPHRK